MATKTRQVDEFGNDSYAIRNTDGTDIGTIGKGCGLCVPDGEVNGRPFLVCTERCAPYGEPADEIAGVEGSTGIEGSVAYWLGCADG